MYYGINIENMDKRLLCNLTIKVAEGLLFSLNQITGINVIVKPTN